MTCGCSIHSPYIGAPLDSRSAPVSPCQGPWDVSRPQGEKVHTGPEDQFACQSVQHTRAQTGLMVYICYCCCVVHPHQDVVAREEWEDVFQGQKYSQELEKVYVKTLESLAPASSHKPALVNATSPFWTRQCPWTPPESGKTGPASGAETSRNLP